MESKADEPVQHLLKPVLLKLIKNRTGCDFTLTGRGEKLLIDAGSEGDDKRKTALIINALEIINSTQVEGCGTSSAESLTEDIVGYLYYCNDDLCEKAVLSSPELSRITVENIINVEMENGIPKSVTFSQLTAPIFSMAFMGVITNIYFVNSREWLYDQDM